MGVANKKSVAYKVAQALEQEGATVIYSVRSEARKKSLENLLKDKPVYVCDVENSSEILTLAEEVGKKYGPLHGLLHSIAFANYSQENKDFHYTNKKDFLQAVNISAFSLVEIAAALKPYLHSKASVVTISISSTQLAASNYGYMSPIKAALEGCVRYLAKSFSKDSSIRFNSIKAGPLKTSASAGIPGYLDNYLFAEALTFRKTALKTEEVANTALFLLSECSSAINGQGIVVDAGLGLNFFDETVVQAFSNIQNNAL